MGERRDYKADLLTAAHSSIKMLQPARLRFGVQDVGDPTWCQISFMRRFTTNAIAALLVLPSTKLVHQEYDDDY